MSPGGLGSRSLAAGLMGEHGCLPVAALPRLGGGGFCDGSSVRVLSSSPPSLTFLMSLRMEAAKDVPPWWAGLSSAQSQGM